MKTGLPFPKSVMFPKSAAQLTGMLVTAIVVFGTDVDVTYAVPLGVAAGALAMFFVSLAEGQDAVQRAYQARLERLKQSRAG